MNRRYFLGNSTLAVTASLKANSLDASSTINVGIMGMGTRGNALAKALAPMEGVRVSWIVEPDKNRMGQSANLVSKALPKGNDSPKTSENYQRVLDDKSVDALIVTAPNHWHAPATLLACAAGKHVYVEKPCCHNPQEGKWVLEGAKNIPAWFKLALKGEAGLAFRKPCNAFAKEKSATFTPPKLGTSPTGAALEKNWQPQFQKA